VSGRWDIWIDRGGTFTDCLGRDPVTGAIRQVKVLSSDRAPLVGIRRLLALADDAAIPPCDVRMGTTIATNALLERRGTPTALAMTRGFGDLLIIGDQTRPEIFAIDIRRPEQLYSRVVEVDARAGMTPAPADSAREALAAALASGARSLAVVLLGAYAEPELEHPLGDLARELGFDHVSLSSDVAREIGMVGRGDTTVVDAYLTPLIRDYVATLRAELPGSTLRLMQSSGGLAGADHFRGKNAVLSGPAGGVVAYARIAAALGIDRAIGFDMGGTSTDVSAWDGSFERTYETEVAGVRLRAPMMSIHTVAAGGGSLCRYDGFRFTVGPASAGADPGPLCYGNPAALELALTDINLALGRVAGDRFPFPLAPERVDAALDAVREQLARAGRDMARAGVAAGFAAIATSNMAEAIRRVSVARGRDVRDYALVVFGGAGGQHACPLARQLGIRTLIFDRFAGVLSAYGMGLADISWHGEENATDLSLAGAGALVAVLATRFDLLAERGRAALIADGASPERIDVIRRVDLRYRGADTSLTIDMTATADELARGFEAAHEQLFGYTRPGHPIDLVVARVEVISRAGAEVDAGNDAVPTGTPPAPLRTQAMWTGEGFEDVQVYRREALPPGCRLVGPALVLDPTGTIAVDPGFELELTAAHRVILRDTAPAVRAADDIDTAVDPVRLEIFNNLFMSIATQMGEALRRTAMSTNIRERLDFSCAVFDATGGLVANAPHIPVHLGAMGESIKAVLAAHPAPAPGSVFFTNDPAAGGSHLPDITVITPVHDSGGELLFFTASRGHHADIGGITPGSMPPDSRALTDEGVVFRALEIVTAGRFDEAGVRAALAAGPYPARDPDANVADLQAQIAANRAGAHLLERLLRERGRASVLAYMQHVQDNAAAEVAAEIDRLPDGEHRFADALDDGTPIAVTVRVSGHDMAIDFAGTGAQVPGNLNAPRAVTVAAVFYVLRALVGAPIPLNSGVLRHVRLSIPEGSVLSPSPDAAVAGGNVETSQRVVDVLLGALGLAAASQGTMNNLTFGNDRFGYYETIAGGAGATPHADGASGVHTHMTNTRLTDPEVLEARYPVRVVELSLRRDSGGRGLHCGGDGVVRELELGAPMRVSILSERRTRAPFGLAGGAPGAPGRNLWNGRELPAKTTFDAAAGDRVRIETPGGGGWGAPVE